MYEFTVEQTEDGWVYKAFGPLNYTSHPFNSKRAAYDRACELGFIPRPGTWNGNA